MNDVDATVQRGSGLRGTPWPYLLTGLGERADVVHRSSDRNPQWFCISGDMGQHRAALMRDDEGCREVPRIGLRPQFSPVAHCSESGLEHVQPSVVTDGEIVADFVVGVDQLA